LIERRWSHSGYQDYAECGWKYKLKRVEKVPQRPYLAGPAGTAFHAWTDVYDREFVAGNTITPYAADLFHEAFEVALKEEEEKSSVSRDQFTVSGRPTKDKPNGEDIAYWRDVLGPELCRKYVTYRENSDTTIAQDLPQDANGNTVGIEYELSYSIGQVRVKAYVDRVEYDIDGNLIAIDTKTWARKRLTAQLPGYVIGLQKAGIKAVGGAYYEARKGVLSPVQFFTWTEGTLSYLYEQAAVMEAQGLYLPRVSDDCGWCSVRDHCQFALRNKE
jgi:hypothetical protein